MLCHIIQKERPGAVLVFMTGWDDINSLKDQLQSHPLLGDPSRVLLLACHGSMASSEQVILHLLASFILFVTMVYLITSLFTLPSYFYVLQIIKLVIAPPISSEVDI